jgi:hypothetical protein
LGAGACSLLGPRLVRAADPLELLAEVERLSAALRGGTVDAVDWQTQVEALLAAADPVGVRAALTLDWAAIAATTRREGRVEQRLEAAELEGTPAQPHFRRKLFSLRRGHAVVPHGHRNIASVFFVLDGRVRGRHYDRLRDEPEAIVIRPIDDRTFEPGDAAAISDELANIHWFTALDDQAVLLNFSVTVPPNRRAAGDSTGRVYLDPEGEALGDGLIRAPRATLGALRRKYDGSGR